MVARHTRERWGAEMIVVHGQVYRPEEFPGFIAYDAAHPSHWLGLTTYRIDGDACEILTIESLAPRAGVGTALLETVKSEAVGAGCRRLWLITTNDNLDAIRFYQRRGFVLAALHRDAIKESRKLKPQIPLLGDYGIPMRDELEFEMWLGNGKEKEACAVLFD